MNAIDSPRRELRDGSESWLRPAAAVAAIGWGANVFVPLIVLYQQHGISLLATEVMFGCYAVGLVPALLAGGRWSDRTSRKVDAGIADIQHAARPVQLGVATSSVQAISYLGFAFPYLLTLAHNEIGWSPAGGLIAFVVVAIACTAWLSVSTRTKGAQ